MSSVHLLWLLRDLHLLGGGDQLSGLLLETSERLRTGLRKSRQRVSVVWSGASEADRQRNMKRACLVAHIYSPRQEGHDFEASLGYIRSYLK